MIEIYGSAHVLAVTKELAPWPKLNVADTITVTAEDGTEVARFILSPDSAAAIAAQLAPPADVDAAFADASRVVNSPESDHCPDCWSTGGNHSFVHVRHGNGGGHNEPCPRVPR